MQALEFNSIIARENTTPGGGSIAIGIGTITDLDGKEMMGTAFQVKDKNGDIVTQFALVQDSFAVFMDTMMQVYAEAHRIDSELGEEGGEEA